MSKNIQITLEEYLELVGSNEFLQCLYHQGLEEWEGFDDACEEFAELEKPIQ
jgi:hypothetical protein